MSYYISPRFLNQLAVHITKNFLDLPQVRMPLIFGVHGRKGEGKTFQCELIYERMGVNVVHISGGELESPDAGDPARLIRLRYREAAELVKVRGEMAVLMINDLDAGAGRFDGMTQYTVNTQLVNNTLMNIADNPTNVQLPGSYDDTPLARIPIVVTGNDFATLYAPLVRDGRMQKFYWEPDRDDRLGIVGGIFAPDGLGSKDIETLVDTFENQAIDFYGALRSKIYDEQIIDFIHRVGVENVSRNVVNTKTPPSFKQPNFRTDHLIEVGTNMVMEQRRLQEMGLVKEYNQALNQTQAVPPTQAAYPPQFAPQAYLNDNDYLPYRHRHALSVMRSSPAVSNPGEVATSKVTPPPIALESPLPEEVQQDVRNLMAQGYGVGMEYVDQRRFRTNSWRSCPVIQGGSEPQVLQSLGQCLADHTQDYVRLIGIDPGSKRRILERIIYRPLGRQN
ncbi:ribulose bisphosphate carboxylase small subunit [Leptothoe sp. PORK10 BA2]|uniref:ribulose bisphosphate carboxylase small subunit n=1 Tax=Leptothoe sp. PORK10 BA2 TaxID=3110254 RepID=UPI002B2207C3|nr:ribulose bisphosphate carboxylase small subunit [Leptothoe sp. PORK10 BA2]MEA5464178.1 ribulose bisphosphate carboxylase small subunit [Leptothoe sp. PORK10 BA2]